MLSTTFVMKGNSDIKLSMFMIPFERLPPTFRYGGYIDNKYEVLIDAYMQRETHAERKRDTETKIERDKDKYRETETEAETLRLRH